LADEIEAAPIGAEELAGFGCEAPHQRCADHALMAGDEYALAREIEWRRRGGLRFDVAEEVAWRFSHGG
jgi:hypothetical protein